MKPQLSEKEFKKMVQDIWKSYLENASQEEIYQSVVTSNYDDNSFLLNWIKNDPKTDQASIMAAY